MYLPWPNHWSENNLAGWVTSSVTLSDSSEHALLSFLNHEARPKSDTELLLIVTSWKLYTLPSLFFFTPPFFLHLWLPPFWSLAFDSLQRFSWQVSDWSSLSMHTRGREGRRWEALRPLRAYTRLHSSPPISPLPTPPECFCNWRVDSIMSCLLTSWYYATLYYWP